MFFIEDIIEKLQSKERLNIGEIKYIKENFSIYNEKVTEGSDTYLTAVDLEGEIYAFRITEADSAGQEHFEQPYRADFVEYEGGIALVKVVNQK